jgi:hypothetical protein
VYRGIAAGAQEGEDVNAKFFSFVEPFGEGGEEYNPLEEEYGKTGKQGALIIFKTTAAGESHLNAEGVWAATAK